MVAPQPFFEPRGTPFSVLGRLKALSFLGHEVDLVTYHVGENVSLPGITIHRIPNIPFIKRIPVGPSFTKLLLDSVLLLKTALLLIRYRYDLIHSHEEASFFNIVYAKALRIPHLYDMHSSLPQQLKNFEFTKNSWIIRAFEWMERKVINSSRAIITICPALEHQVKAINDQTPHQMIENVVTEGSPDVISGEVAKGFLTEHALEDRKIILYAGTLEPYQGIDLLIECAVQVVEKYPEVMFLIMGGKSDQVKDYQQRVQHLGLTEHFLFTGMRPPQEIPVAVRVSDVLVSPRIKGTNTPLKIYSYLQSGKPIIATNLPTHTQVLDARVAILVDPTPQAFAKGIVSVLDQPQLGETLGQQARILFDSQFSFDRYIERTNQILNIAIR